MIRVCHNGGEQTLNASCYANLGEAIEASLALDGALSSVVLQVSVNGCSIPEESLGKLGSFPLEGIAEIEIESGAPNEVARSCLGHCAEYTSRVRESLGRTAELLRQGRVEEGNGLYAEVLDALSILVAAVEASSRALGEEATPLIATLEDLGPWFEQLVAAQEGSDWVRVADYLEFELDPILERCAGQIQGVQERWRETQGDAHGV